ncbi:heavy metal sensor histidine kinase [Orbus mooreae]|uniref:heavy metal sensor histidine kinase n=1 Tax=Orbus mooreae TaxID=3074107 RepID=UPI00370D8987
MSSLKKKCFSKIRFFYILKVPIITCLLACLLLYGLSYIIKKSFEKYSISQNIIELNSVIDSIERELSYYDPEQERNELIQNILLILASHHQLFVNIIGNDNNILYKTRGLNLYLASQKLDNNDVKTDRHSGVVNYDNSSYLIVSSRIYAANNEPFTITVAIKQDMQLEFIERLHNGLLILLALACFLILIGTSVTIYFTQKPINQLIKKISLIDSKSLKVKIPRELVPIKYASLVDAFNEMISRMDAVFQRQQDFTADIAHEMRTPITNLTTQTQIALNNARTAEEYKEVLYSNLEEFEKLSQIITDMLFLAQADNKLLIPKLGKIDLTEMFNRMFDYYEYVSEDKRIKLILKGTCPDILGDKLMISRAVSNLLSNAIRHTPVGETITVTLSRLNPNSIKIIVANPGQPIEAKHLPLLFDRFYRTDESRQRNGEGAGIGLAIVKSIIEAHQGEITAESDDNSTRFIMIFPLPLSKVKNPHN